MSITFDSHELAALAHDFGKIGAASTKALTPVFADAADDLVTGWASNARATSGVHGKHYPESIDKERLVSTDIAFEVGPNPTKRQGKMAFETGSANQPPHPDGQRAADTVVPTIDRRLAAALAYLGL